MRSGELSIETDNIPLFSSLSRDELSYLLPRLRSQSFRRGDLVLARGALSDGLYLITSGLVGVSLQDAPEADRDIATLGTGECVGEMSLMNGEPCSATIHALTDATALVIQRSDFADVVERCPTLWRNLSGILSRRLIRTNRRLSDERQAAFTTLFLLVQPETAAPLATALGALLAGQSHRRVLLLDISGRVGLVEGNTSTNGATAITGIRDFEIEIPESNEPLHVASWQAATDEEVLLMEQLRPAYDEVVLVSDGRDLPGARSWLSQSTSTVIVCTEATFGEAADLSREFAGNAHRVDIAIMTGLAVVSDNGVGGLWEPSIVPLSLRVGDALKAADKGIRFRFIPRDSGLLARVRAAGIGALAKEPEDEPFLQALSRLARRIGHLEVGVALGAGMAKGFSHIGVLRALREHGVPVDYLAGSSIGSIVGSVYAGGMPLEQLRGLMTGADKRFVRLTLPLKSISSNRGLRKILTTCHERAPTAQFPELFIPFAAVATDIDSGREVVLKDGTVWNAVMASISMPGIFPPVEYDGRVLADGGLVNPVPGKTVREMGADIVIAVDLAAKSGRAPVEGSARVPNIIEMLWRTMEIMLGEITSRSAASADVTVQPNTGHSHIRDFSQRGAEFIAAGEQAALEALPQIATLLPSIKVVVLA